MATITYRTDDETKERLASFADQQNMSINKAIDMLVSNAIKDRELYDEFQKRANQGDPRHALNILKAKASK